MADANWEAALSSCYYDSLTNLELWAKINSVLSILCCDKNLMIRNDLGKKGLVSVYTSQVTCLPSGKETRAESQGRNLEERPEIETVRRRGAFWFDPPQGFLCFFRHPWTTCQGPHHPYWAGSFHIIINQGRAPQACLQVSGTGIFSAEVSSSQITRLTSSRQKKKKSHQDELFLKLLPWVYFVTAIEIKLRHRVGVEGEKQLDIFLSPSHICHSTSVTSETAYICYKHTLINKQINTFKCL